MRSSAALICPLLLLVACGSKEQASVAESESPTTVNTETFVVDETPRFFDVTAETGVDWKHNNGSFGARWLPETMGPGVVIFDADRDEDLDLLFVNGSHFPGRPGDATPPGLFLNEGDLRFREAAESWGLEPAYCLGGIAGDIDNDGDADLYLSCVGRDRLLKNEGGRFVDASAEVGLSEAYEFGASAVFFDADRDGWLDLYATRYVVWSPELDQDCQLYGEGESYCTPSIYEGASGRFYRNLGDGTFEEQTEAAGLFQPEAKALGVVAADFDGDGWDDLAVACDTVPNLLFHNQGDGTFEEIGLASGLALTIDGRVRGGMGIDFGDFERTGQPGIAITYFADEMAGLYRNLGDQLFFDIAGSLPFGRSTLETLGWGVLFFDYDLDGWLDLLIANGHLDSKANDTPGSSPWAQPQQLFQNRARNFVEVTSTVGGDLATPIVGRGAAFGDLDGDGDLDLVLTTNGGSAEAGPQTEAPAKVFENRGANGAWLQIDLEGKKSNRDALGAVVTVLASGQTQTWQLRSGGSYLSQSQISPIFGLGSASMADEVRVRWPSGTEQTLVQVEANQRLKIVESP